jgi:hypothetical protein
MKSSGSFLKKCFFLAVFLVTGINNLQAIPPTNKGNDNASSSCFLNATIQALFHLKPFREFLEWAEQEKIYAGDSMPKALIDHINKMAKNTEIVNPRSFRNTFARCSTDPEIKKMESDQHDAEEFYSNLVDRLWQESIYVANANAYFNTIISTISTAPQALTKTLWLSLTADSKKFPETYINNPDNLKNDLLEIVSREEKKELKALLYNAIQTSSKEQYNTALANIKTAYSGSLLKQDRVLDALINQVGFNNTSCQLLKNIFNLDKKTGGWFSKKIEFQNIISSFPNNLIDNLYTHCDSKDSDKEYAVYSALKVLYCDTPPLNFTQWNDLKDIINTANWNNLIKQLLNMTNLKKDRIEKLFGKSLESTITCGYDNTHVIASHPPITRPWSWPLALDPSAKKLDELIRQKYKWECSNSSCSSKNNSQISQEQIKITKIPDILVFNVERFKQTPNGIWKKNQQLFIIPEKLSSNPDTLSWDGNFDYLLSAIVMQSGSLSGGHYWAYARWYDDNKWYFYDDCGDRAREATDQEINDLLNPKNLANNAKNPLATPYLLFYVKTNQPEKSPVIPEKPSSMPPKSDPKPEVPVDTLGTKLTDLAEDLTKFNGELKALEEALTNLKNALGKP